MRILEDIVSNKRLEVARRKVVVPPGDLAHQLGRYSVRDFGAAISGGCRIIAEIKRKSPSVDCFRRDLDVAELAKTYERNGAAAISVVTDTTRFDTSLSDARVVREATELPLLVKDFVVDPYQVYEARAFGADAILLIARIASLTALRSLIGLAHELGMEALVETHTEQDLRKACEAGARVIGVNNRDLDSLEVSLDVTRALVDEAPSGVLLVSESGISSRAEIDELSARGVGAFLIGSALLRSADPGRLLRELAGPQGVQRGRPSSNRQGSDREAT